MRIAPKHALTSEISACSHRDCLTSKKGHQVLYASPQLLTVIMVIQLAVQRSKNLCGTQWDIIPSLSSRKNTGGIPMTGMVTLKSPKSRYRKRPRAERMRFWMGFRVA